MKKILLLFVSLIIFFGKNNAQFSSIFEEAIDLLTEQRVDKGSYDSVVCSNFNFSILNR